VFVLCAGKRRKRLHSLLLNRLSDSLTVPTKGKVRTMQRIPTLTGKAFVPGSDFEDQLGEVFQLEVAFDGFKFRLQGDGSLSDACWLDKDHFSLSITEVLESDPLIYVVSCSCGYRIEMRVVKSSTHEMFEEK